ncbi:hypothetical protein ACWC0C_43430 [Streptomyces sp. NPDC001709]
MLFQEGTDAGLLAGTGMPACCHTQETKSPHQYSPVPLLPVQLLAKPVPPALFVLQ